MDDRHTVSGGSGDGAVAMTSLLGLSAGFANVVVLLVLAVAVVSPRVSQLARLVIATFAFACAWLATCGV
jgi:hypothetical protein